MSRPPPHQRHRIILHQGNEWKSWQELTVKVIRLPSSITTRELHKHFQNEGEVTKIEIKGSGVFSTIAFITYSPPPFRSFWNTSYRISGSTPSTTVEVPIELLPRQRIFTVQSPVDPAQVYPESMRIPTESIGFGFMHSETSMMVMHRVSPEGKLPMTLTVNLQRREVEVRFSMNMFDEQRKAYVLDQFRFRVKFSQIKGIHERHDGGCNKQVWVILTDSPPWFYKKLRNTGPTHMDTERTWREWQAWYRQTDITHSRQPLKNSPVGLKKANPVIDIGRWMAYRFEFDMNSPSTAQYKKMQKALMDYNINILPDSIVQIIDKQKPHLWDMIDLKQHESGSALATLTNAYDSHIPLSFALRYQLEVCISHGYLNEHNITRQFLERLVSMEQTTARNLLERVADLKRRIFNPMDVFKLSISQKPTDKSILKYCVYARSANVTPSMVYYATPNIEVSNRIVRQYSSHEDRFLRVKFTEEKNEGRINSTDSDMDNEIFTRVWRTLRNGITIGDRHYEFLAFGNSQFREHGAYFFAPTKELTAADIRYKMGDFHHINQVALYAARLGQCLSTTRAVQCVSVKVTGIPDIERDGYNFTDGVGKISRFLSQIIGEEFSEPNAVEDPPSLFQFRLGGCKGVLAVSPELKEREIHVRWSQRKFDAIKEGLEIIRISKLATAMLNRQIIIVLDALGVPNHVFIARLQEDMAELNAAMWSENIALRSLQETIDFNQMTLAMASMILDGFMASKEPFMMSILRLWRTWRVKSLKEKARIRIKDGAFLLGCVDETATLRGHFIDYVADTDNPLPDQMENLPEIFVRVSEPENQGSYQVIEGICVVARNPSLHAGDIRVVRAVDVPALHHLKNVIVFPQTGDRDIPNMCSGGDLDGDDYLVMWDKDLIPREVNHPAMNFSPPPKIEVEGEPTAEDISKFFVEYIKNDSLGRIASAHLVFADYEDEGVKSEKCVSLAKLHSLAVDYPKSGVPAKMSHELKPKMYPHFMPRKGRPRPKDRVYKSKKILGQLYDQVDRVDFMPQYELSFDARILDAYSLREDTLTKASKLKEAYDAALRRIMAQHGILTEFEVWTTFVLEHNNETRDYQMAEEFGRISLALKQRFQDLCYEEAGGRSHEILGPFVAAMYTVTARQMQTAIQEYQATKSGRAPQLLSREMDFRVMPLMSFPWIFREELGHIANAKNGERAGLEIVENEPQRRIRAKKPVASKLQDGYNFHDGDKLKNSPQAEQSIMRTAKKAGVVDGLTHDSIQPGNATNDNIRDGGLAVEQEKGQEAKAAQDDPLSLATEIGHDSHGSTDVGFLTPLGTSGINSPFSPNKALSRADSRSDMSGDLNDITHRLSSFSMTANSLKSAGKIVDSCGNEKHNAALNSHLSSDPTLDKREESREYEAEEVVIEPEAQTALDMLAGILNK
ncbi:uncharacterized protein K452DRAFT_348841 [Aplosporella prunicola CBS 121167]|uniref:RNA-dependent RNA polymerase n=1 Tax=Aplosporella prunicola CBS 121167 TaxID=1176127 RepID=A0A6A6BSQ1_9PEZI|nr:uncharacterized protein K452DRAFT_348841 [Aplosporella prunicola CBS 121167]KAF2146274.1 hypothetical protein K452DRAFT_348841 [Aplosporella prunicola CBS 121167]